MKNKLEARSKTTYAGLEPALVQANESYIISCDRRDVRRTKVIVGKIVRRLVDAMKQQCPSFSKLHAKNFYGGSLYEETKIGKADECDIDILLKVPEILEPVLEEDNVAGFAQLRLKNFQNFAEIDADLYRTISKFIDSENYLLPDKLRTSFIRNLFEEVIFKHFPSYSINIANHSYQICRIEHNEPALTLTIRGPNFYVDIDLVTSIILGKNFWPVENCRPNPFSSPSEFFLTPTKPKQQHTHRHRFWRLSFHLQERRIVSDRFWMKPAMRVLKRIRDYFNHSVRSYAIKTIFLWELEKGNPVLDQKTPDLWKYPLSFVVVYMLEKYLQCLDEGNISDFWNPKLNLLCYLTDEEVEKCRDDIGRLLDDVKKNPQSETILKYLI